MTVTLRTARTLEGVPKKRPSKSAAKSKARRRKRREQDKKAAAPSLKEAFLARLRLERSARLQRQLFKLAREPR